MQKKKQKCKKKQKIYTKKYQKWKKESTFIWIFFAFISPVHFFTFQTLKFI